MERRSGSLRENQPRHLAAYFNTLKANDEARQSLQSPHGKRDRELRE
jgi:hypothetical protein